MDARIRRRHDANGKRTAKRRTAGRLTAPRSRPAPTGPIVRSAAEAIVQMLVDAGVRRLFGNPGTTELPLLDHLLVDGRIDYVLGLNEVAVMAMADGFSTASRKLGVVNLHVSCGLGNAMAMLYNAYRAGTPLLVTAGQQDRRLAFEEPILWSDMAGVARRWTKWSAEVRHILEVPSAIRRAIQTALTPPTGPVFLALPMDLQAERAELDITPALPLDVHVRPPIEALRKAAATLRAAKNPVILVGSRVVELGAVDELVEVAELLGAPAVCESGTTHGRLGFPCDHSLYGKGLPLWSYEVQERLKEFDVALIVGMDVFRQYLYHEPRPIPDHLKLIHIDEDAWQLGKNYPLEVGIVGHTKTSLGELAGVLRDTMTSAGHAAAKARRKTYAEQSEAARKAVEREIDRQWRQRPMTPATLMGALARAMPANAAVVEEAVTTTGTLLERLGAIKDPALYFGHRGWALGWGIGAAIGVRLAWPDRPVLSIVGEGAAMYSVQTLWSAAHYKVPVTFVVCNNAQYQILKIGAQSMGLKGAKAGKFLANDLVDPEIDYVQLARSLGIEARRIEDPDELQEAVAESLAGDKPRLFDVPIERQVPGRLNYG
ncbi:MAG: thiamine pyrophosphate-binding protein [Planctomycetia bacterium]|nr:thiamine pyrophosphate-binding protein [Planctomycetia bacterium]